MMEQALEEAALEAPPLAAEQVSTFPGQVGDGQLARNSHDLSRDLPPGTRRTSSCLRYTDFSSDHPRGQRNVKGTSALHSPEEPKVKGARIETPAAGQSAPIRRSSDGVRKRSITPSEAVRRGLDFGPLKNNGPRHNSTTGTLKTASKSPSSRLDRRSLSATGEVLSSSGVGRLQKDYCQGDADGEGGIQSSDEDSQAWSSGDESSGSTRPRGRKREGRSKPNERSTAKSPLATGEKPAVTVTGPDGEKSTAKRFIVRPNTNYDEPISRASSPHTSDSEELNDIRRAQRLNINSSPLDSSIPHRVIQTIIRGDFAEMQEEADDGTRRLRTYLVATDLSGEAAYALEWTIGTVLRDGDTLIAVYAVDEEIGTGMTGDCLPIGEGAKAMQDATAVMEKMTAASQKGSLISLPPLSRASLRSGSRKSSAACSTDSKALSKAEQERLHAIETLSETCLRFLRKTKLQVRIAIEVIHCKSPKYMITEAVSPELLRGRSSS